jgi:putative ABC transport system permease protein
MTVGLIRSETGRDLRTLTATGASTGTRRATPAATAGALGLLGAVLGYLATTAFFRSELSERMGHPPVVDLLLILIGPPGLAAAGAWLSAGRQPPDIGHRPLD